MLGEVFAVSSWFAFELAEITARIWMMEEIMGSTVVLARFWMFLERSDATDDYCWILLLMEELSLVSSVMMTSSIAATS